MDEARKTLFRIGRRRPRLGLTVVVIMSVIAGYALHGLLAPEPAPRTAAPEADAQPRIYTCSMHPQIENPGPGDCPICGMDLIPRSEADDGGGGAGPRAFATTEEALALMDLETAPVERKFVQAEVRMVGAVDYDETKLATITAWVPGRIERMFADYEGIQVRRGDHMVELYSPELLAAKEELRRAAKALADLSPGAPEVLRDTARGTLDAARRKLGRWGLTEAQVDQAQRAGAPSDRITIYAPISGTVIERAGKEGMYVDTGTPIYTIAGLDTVWVQLEAYESDLPWVHYGQTVQFSTESYPGEVFEGTIAFIAPTLDRDTRTVDVRVNVANPEGLLKPGMFVRAVVRSQVATRGRVMDPALAGKWISPMHPEVVKDGPGDCDVCGMALVPAEELGYVTAEPDDDDKPLVIPATAPLITGKRAVVYVKAQDRERPVFEGRQIELGPRAGDYFIVARGLEEGELVVTEGAFKIDSALEIAAKPSMMAMDGGPIDRQPAHEVETPAAFEQQLHALFAAYMDLQRALAYEEYETASKAADAVREAFAAVDADLLMGMAATRWEEEHGPPLEEAVQAMAAAETVDGQRAAFEEVSDALTEALRVYGMAGDEPVYRLWCPMAFDDTGAYWLQTDESTRNPYFGSEMFACGWVRETIREPAPEEGEAGDAHGHAGHDHGGGS